MPKNWKSMVVVGALVIGAAMLIVEKGKGTAVPVPMVEDTGPLRAGSAGSPIATPSIIHSPSLPHDASLLLVRAVSADAIRGGDLAAARRVMHDTIQCTWATQVLRDIDKSLASSGKASSADADKDLDIQKLNALSDTVSKAKSIQEKCEGVSISDLEKSAYSSMLAAAELGDVSAAECYVGAAISTPDFQDAEETRRHTINARRLLQTGIKQGEWHMVYAMELLGSSERPITGWFWSLQAPDELQAYRYRALRWYGSDEEMRAEIKKKQLTARRKLLSAGYSKTDFDSAEKWAAQEYNDYFAHGSASGDTESLCPNVYHIGTELPARPVTRDGVG